MVRHNLKCQIQGGRFVTSGVELIRRAATQSFFTMLLFTRVWGVVWHVKKSVFCEKRICVLSLMVQMVGMLYINGHMRIQTRTPRNTTFAPSIHTL